MKKEEVRKHFKNFRKFFYQLCDDNEYEGDNIASYFEVKAEIVDNALNRFIENTNEFAFEFADPEAREFTFIQDDSEGVGTVQHDMDHIVNSEALIEVFKELIRDGYEPPVDNYAGMQIHLFALLIFYKYIRPRTITINLILKLDITTLKVIQAATTLASSIPFATKEKRRLQAVNTSKGKQGDKTKEKILLAYKSLSPQWLSNDRSKKPILLDEQNISINKLAEKVWLKLQESHRDIPTQQWIAICLKELKKKETI